MSMNKNKIMRLPRLPIKSGWLAKTVRYCLCEESERSEDDEAIS